MYAIFTQKRIHLSEKWYPPLFRAVEVVKNIQNFSPQPMYYQEKKTTLKIPASIL